MRTARSVAAAIGAVTIGALLWATPTQAALPGPSQGNVGQQPGNNQGNGGNQPGGNQPVGNNQGAGGKVRVTVTAGVCGTRSARTFTMRIVVPAQGVGTGPYTATATVNHTEIGRLQSLGATPRTKRIVLAEDSHDGLARVLVRVTGGRPALRPAPSITKVVTNCRPPVRPTVTSTGPTCANRNMVVTVTNPNLLREDKVRVRIGTSQPKVLRPGQSTSLTVRSGLWVWAGSPLRRLKNVSYVQPVGCPAAASPAALPALEQVSSGGDSNSSGSSGNSGSNNNGSSSGSNNGDSGNNGGLPVTGAGVAGITVAGLLLAGAGVAGLMFARRRKTSFTA